VLRAEAGRVSDVKGLTLCPPLAEHAAEAKAALRGSTVYLGYKILVLGLTLAWRSKYPSQSTPNFKHRWQWGLVSSHFTRRILQGTEQLVDDFRSRGLIEYGKPTCLEFVSQRNTAQGFPLSLTCLAASLDFRLACALSFGSIQHRA
jgi:hypothetical protein